MNDKALDILRDDATESELLGILSMDDMKREEARKRAETTKQLVQQAEKMLQAKA